MDFCRKHNAKFFENGDCVWIYAEDNNKYKLAIALQEDGNFYFGEFDNKSNDFEISEEVVYSPDAIPFILKTLTIFKKWKIKKNETTK